MAHTIDSIDTTDVTATGGQIDGNITFHCSDATFDPEQPEIALPTSMGGKYIFTPYDREEHQHGVAEVDQFSITDILHRTDSDAQDPIDKLANQVVEMCGVVLLAEFSTPHGNEIVLYVLDDATV